MTTKKSFETRSRALSRTRHPSFEMIGAHMKTCEDKLRFKRFCHAVQAADHYMEDIALVFSPMTPYRCATHQCYHIGHSRWMNRSNIRTFTDASRQRAQLRARGEDRSKLPWRILVQHHRGSLAGQLRYGPDMLVTWG